MIPSQENHPSDDSEAASQSEEIVDDINNGNTRYKLDVGDHIYSWRGAGAWSHHGIVISVSKVLIAIIDFYPEGEFTSQINSETNTKEAVKLRVILLEEWKAAYGTPYKVTYKAGYLRRSLRRSGTCTSCESGPTFLVLARIRFLLGADSVRMVSSTDLLPSYHSLHSNSETAAFWCKTGYWTTMQVADFLHLTLAGQLKSSITLGAYVTAQTVTVPAAGFWGYLGFTTKVTLASTQPLLLPLIAGYGLVTVTMPLWLLNKCRSNWDNTTTKLHEHFWAAAPNELIVECIEKWTDLAPHATSDMEEKYMTM